MMIMIQRRIVVVIMLMIQSVRSYECRSTIEFTNVGCEVGCGEPAGYNQGCIFYSDRIKRCSVSEGRCKVSENPNECDLLCFTLYSDYDDWISDANPNGDIVKTLMINVRTRYETLGQLKLPADLDGITFKAQPWWNEKLSIQPNTFEQNVKRFRHLSLTFVPHIDVQYLPPTLESLRISRGRIRPSLNSTLPPNLKRLTILNGAAEEITEVSQLLQAPAPKLDSLIMMHWNNYSSFGHWDPPRGSLPVLRHLQLRENFKTIPENVFDIPSLEIM